MNEGARGGVDILCGVGRSDGEADARGAWRNGRRSNGLNGNALRAKALGDAHGVRRPSEDDRNDVSEAEWAHAAGNELLAKARREAEHLRPEIGRFPDD